MARQLALRLLSACFLLLVIFLAGFALLRLMPGDFAEVLLMSQMDGTLPDPETVARFSAENGFDRPLPIQYLAWLENALYEPRYRDHFDVPAGATSLIDVAGKGAMLYDDTVTTGGRMLVTALDPMYHHGSHFMPATTRFPDGLLPWLKSL